MSIKAQLLPLSKRTLRQRIDTLSNGLPDIDTSALGPVFTGTPGQSDLVWAVQLLDGLSPQLSLTLFKQYVRRRKDGSTRHARNGNIWLRERTKLVRGLIQALPVDLQALRDEESRKRMTHQFANQTAAIWHNIEQGIKAGDEPDLLLTWEAIRQPADQWGFIGDLPEFKTEEVRDNWILSVMVRLLSAKWWEKRINRTWDRLQEHINIVLGKVRKGVSAYCRTPP